MTFSVEDRDYRLGRQRGSVEAVIEHLPPDASFLSISAPQALVLSGKTNPTRHQVFATGLGRYIDDTWPDGLEGFGEWIGREQPTMITVAGGLRPWMTATIEADYRRVGRAPGWTWYAHQSLGPDVLADLWRAS